MCIRAWVDERNGEYTHDSARVGSVFDALDLFAEVVQFADALERREREDEEETVSRLDVHVMQRHELKRCPSASVLSNGLWT